MKRVTLSRQGACGERIEAKESGTEDVWSVLFFDEDSVSGHARLDGKKMLLAGWWGAARHLRPTVSDLSETELWETAPMGFQLQIGEGQGSDVFFAWGDGRELSGYRRREGG